MREVEGVQGDAEGLEHRAVGLGQRIGERHQAALRPRDPFSEAAVLRAVAGVEDVFAEVGMPGGAGFALAAGDGRVHGHAAAVFGDAAELVAEDEGPADVRVPIPPSMNQCRSEPQRPTAPTRTSVSPGPAAAAPRRGA